MTQDEFPDDLISHCEQKALEAVASDTAGLVRAVLRASGYAELVAALKEFVDAAQYDAMMEGPVFKGWNRSQLDRALVKARAAIAAAGHKERNGK